MNNDPPGQGDELAMYAGRWVARLGTRIVGQGGTPEQALRAARAARSKEIPEVVYVSAGIPLSFSSLLERVADALPAGSQVYLVGGAVRDALLRRQVHDLDFVMSGQVMKTAQQVARKLKAAFYPLDDERYTARVILKNGRESLDFAAMRGPDLESDLRSRDFTINAMAVDVHQPEALLDPLGGAADLREKYLRACSPTSIADDPLRILRGVRQAAAFHLHISPETRQQMRQNAAALTRVSPERLRDELFRILDGPDPATVLRALDMLGVLEAVLPEILKTKGVEQSAPHVADVWNHSLDVIQKLGMVLAALDPRYDEEAAASLSMSLVVRLLGRFRQQIGEHLSESLNPERSLRALLLWSALYHDVGKPGTQEKDTSGRIRFFGHEEAGADLIEQRGRALRLSNAEIARVKTIIAHHLRPFWLVQTGRAPSRRAVYRFFRDTGPAGVDVCLLSLADVLATYQTTLTAEAWTAHLEVVRALLEAYWEQPEESISPPAVLTGKDLLEVLNLTPGPLVGELLESIREAQVTGQVRTREEALDWARRRMAGEEEDEDA